MNDILKANRFTLTYPGTYPLYRLRQAFLEKLLLGYFPRCQKVLKGYHAELRAGCGVLTLELWQYASIKIPFFQLQLEHKLVIPIDILAECVATIPISAPVPHSILELQAHTTKLTVRQRQVFNSCQFSFLAATSLIVMTAPASEEGYVQQHLVKKLASLFPQVVFIIRSTVLRAVLNLTLGQQAAHRNLPAYPPLHVALRAASRATRSTPLLLRDIRLSQQPFTATTAPNPTGPLEDPAAFSPAQLLRDQQRLLADSAEQPDSVPSIPELQTPEDWKQLLDHLCAQTHLREFFINSRFGYDAQGLKYVLTDRSPGLVHTYAAVLQELHAAIYGQPLALHFISTNKVAEYSPRAAQVYPPKHLIPRLRWSLTPAHWQAIIQAVPLTTLAYTVLALSRLEIITHSDQQVLAQILVRSTIPQSLLQQVKLAIQDTITQATGTTLVIHAFQPCLDLTTPVEDGFRLLNPIKKAADLAPIRRIYQVLFTPQKMSLAQPGQWTKLVKLCNQQLGLPAEQYFHYRDKNAVQNFLRLVNAVTFQGATKIPQVFRLQLKPASHLAVHQAQAQARFLQFNEVISYMVMELVSFQFEAAPTA